MNTLTGIFPKIDPVSSGLCALKLALDRDYDQEKHDVRFDIVPDPTEGNDPSLWSIEYKIEIVYLGTNSYKTTITESEFFGSLNDTRVIIQAVSTTERTTRLLNRLDERYNK